MKLKNYFINVILKLLNMNGYYSTSRYSRSRKEIIG